MTCLTDLLLRLRSWWFCRQMRAALRRAELARADDYRDLVEEGRDR